MPVDTNMDAYRERLVNARREIDKMCKRAAIMPRTTEFFRLDGKRQGIALALSYLDEWEYADVR